MFARSQASFAVELKSPELLHGVRWFETDVSQLPIGPTFKGQDVQEELIIGQLDL